MKFEGSRKLKAFDLKFFVESLLIELLDDLAESGISFSREGTFIPFFLVANPFFLLSDWGWGGKGRDYFEGVWSALKFFSPFLPFTFSPFLFFFFLRRFCLSFLLGLADVLKQCFFWVF